MTHKIGGTQVDEFTWAYITAMYWTSDEHEFPEYCYSGEFDITEDDAKRLAPESLHEIIADCQKFQEENAELLEASMLSDDQAGHDFWLTRNHHGTGFWDRGVIGGDLLTERAHQYGEKSMYLSNEGMIWVE